MKRRFSCDFWSGREARPQDVHPNVSFIERLAQEPDVQTRSGQGEWGACLSGLNWPTLFDGSDTTDSAANQLVAARRPSCVYVPENYEPNYPYPLIVWFHGGGRSERELLSVMPTISQRNYFGLSLRGTSPAYLAPGENTGGRSRETGGGRSGENTAGGSRENTGGRSGENTAGGSRENTGGRSGENTGGPPGGYRWSSCRDDLAKLEVDLHEGVRALRREFHVHSERVYLAGFDEGATTALELMLRRPEWFGGAICLAGRFPTSEHSLSRFRDLRGKRVLIAGGAQDRVSPPAAVVQAGRILHAAGMMVSTRIVEGGHEVGRTMLRQVDYWLMDGICAAT